MSQFLLVLVRAVNNGGSELLFPAISLFVIFQFWIVASKIECLFLLQWFLLFNAPQACLEEGRHIQEREDLCGARCVETSVIPRHSWSRGDRSSKYWLTLSFKGKKPFDPQRSLTVLCFSQTPAAPLQPNRRAVTHWSIGLSVFNTTHERIGKPAGVCTSVAFLQPEHLWNQMKWKSLRFFGITGHKRTAIINRSIMLTIITFTTVCPTVSPPPPSQNILFIWKVCFQMFPSKASTPVLNPADSHPNHTDAC